MRSLLFTLCLLPLSLPAMERKVVRIDGPGDAWEVSFDTARMSWETAYDIAKLSPDMNYFSYPIIDVTTCETGSAEYAPCGTRDYLDPNFFKNAEVNLRRADALIQHLAKMSAPGALGVVRDHVLKRQKFWLWLHTTRIAYLRTGDIRLLEGGGPAPDTACQESVENVRKARTTDERYRLSLYDWLNCVNGHSELVRQETYPLAAWQKAMTENGISVKDIYEVDESEEGPLKMLGTNSAHPATGKKRP